MDSEENRPLMSLCRAAFPPLDPNGRPLAPTLRGLLADLAELRAVLASVVGDGLLKSNSDAAAVLSRELDARAADSGDRFGDVDVGAASADGADAFPGGRGTSADRPADTGIARPENRNEEDAREHKKRTRGDEGEEEAIEDECDADAADREPLLLYLPSVRCTCAAWDMREVPGDLLVTGLRLLFVAADGAEHDDVALDGRSIALHAVDSSPGEDLADASKHVYCQLADSVGGEGGAPAVGTFAPMRIATESEDDGDDGDDGAGEGRGGDEEQEKEDASSEEDGATEVYFRPAPFREGDDEGTESQGDRCHSLFRALTKLVSLNPAEEGDGGYDGGGGLFSMLSLMAGLGDAGGGFGGDMVIAGRDDESDDDMVVRLGGGNNLVENDDGSEGAPEDERRAMLDRLDDLLVVPPEYEIASSEDGQFDDAEESEDDDDIL